MMKKLLILSLVPYVLLAFPPKAKAINASFMEGQFEEVMYIPQVNKIEAWEQPRTQFTPKNLRSEYQIRYSGSDTNGRNAYSYTTHFTDYDTYITGNGITEDGRYYVRDNTGKGFVTGEVAKDYSNEINNINQSINDTNANVNRINKTVSNVNNMVNNNTKAINGLSSQVSGMSNRIDVLDNRLDQINSKMKQGFATVTALTSLHPNPRSNEKLEVSIGTGMYMDTFAGAVGLFYHPNDRVQIYGGAAYGGHDSWAGGAGITFSLGGTQETC